MQQKLWHNERLSAAAACPQMPLLELSSATTQAGIKCQTIAHTVQPQTS